MESTFDQKRNRLFVILAGIFITNALLAELIGVKIFSIESTLGLSPANINILGFQMDFNLTAGAVIFLALARPSLRAMRRHDVPVLLGLGWPAG